MGEREMTFDGKMKVLVAVAATALLAGCAGMSVGQGASALSGGVFNVIAEAGIGIGRGFFDVGNAVLDTVPFPGPEPVPASPAPLPVPAPPLMK
jgi:hypothetical protein